MVSMHLISMDCDIMRKTANLEYLGLLPTHPKLQWDCHPAQIYAAHKLHGKESQCHIKCSNSALGQKDHRKDDHKLEWRRRRLHLLCIFKQHNLGSRRCNSCQGGPQYLSLSFLILSSRGEKKKKKSLRPCITVTTLPHRTHKASNPTLKKAVALETFYIQIWAQYKEFVPYQQRALQNSSSLVW